MMSQLPPQRQGALFPRLFPKPGNSIQACGQAGHLLGAAPLALRHQE